LGEVTVSNRRFEMYEYRQIIAQLRAGQSNRAIGQTGLAHRVKVAKIRLAAESQGWLDLEKELPDDTVLSTFFQGKSEDKKQAPSIKPYREKVEQWYRQGVQATTIHATLSREYGFKGSYDCVRRLIKKLRAVKINASMILDFKPGECAQVDFGFGPKLINEDTGEEIKTWIFVMTLAWSRHQYAEIIFKQDVMTWLGCHRRAFEFFGGVPKKMVIDNAKCAITKACYYDPQVQRAYYEFAQGYGFIVSACPPYDPQKKGIVEAGVKYIKKNFVPLRKFRTLMDANKQIIEWVMETAGNRIHGTTKEKPLNLFTQTEQILLRALPDNPPELAAWAKVSVHGDCHVQYQKCCYSVPYQYVNQILCLRASETTVRIYQDSLLIAVHVRLFKPGTHTTIAEHLPPNAQAYLMRSPQWCLEQAKVIGENCSVVIEQLLGNNVVDYLRAVQGIIRLSKQYSPARLNAACARALRFQTINYHTLKEILKKGLEYDVFPEEQAFDALTKTYTGHAYFSRDITTLLQ